MHVMSNKVDQQPIRREVGQRRPRAGLTPSPTQQAAMAAMAQYRTRAPKGVFRYDSHEQMEADRMKWTVDAMVAQAAATTTSK